MKAKLRYGEEIRLSGNVPALGSYNIQRAIPLYTSPTDFPYWHTKEGWITSKHQFDIMINLFFLLIAQPCFSLAKEPL